MPPAIPELFTEIKSNFLDFFLKAVSHLAEKLAHFYFCCLIKMKSVNKVESFGLVVTPPFWGI